jgi:hypothetical protein
LKVVRPTRLLAEAAEVLAPFRDAVVVVGAAALEVALADADGVAITPTRDVDVVVPIDRAADIVAHLEAANLERSPVPHERAFTWVRGDLKVQLVRNLHPFATPPARGLPANVAFGMAATEAHQLSVAFADNPAVPRLVCVNAACLLALKQAAFGRTRPSDDTPVERDFHDAYLLVSEAAGSVVSDWAAAEYEVRQRARDAIAQLAEGDAATAAAGRQLVRLGQAASQREAEAAVRRAAARVQRRLQVSADS